MAELVLEDPGASQIAPGERLFVPNHIQNPQQPPPQPPISGPQGGDPWAAFPDAQLGPQVTPGAQQPGVAPAAQSADPWAGFPDADLTKPPKSTRKVGGTEAVGRGLMHGVTFGLEPAIEGAGAAANPDIENVAKKFGIDPEKAKAFIDAIPFLKTAYGAARLGADALTNHDTSTQGKPTQATPAQQAYEAERAKTAEAQQGAYDQHPYLYTGADIAGSAAVPIPGGATLGVGAKLAPRITRGIGVGAIGGGAYGAGNAIGEGKDLRGIASDATSGAVVGGALGGALNGAFGARPKPTTQTPAQRAVEFADKDLGAPLPKGLSYEPNSASQKAAALANQLPFVGGAVAGRAQKTLQAAEREVGEHVNQLTPDASRGATDEALKGSIDTAIENNKATQNSAYDRLRNMINPDQIQKLPRTKKALQDIELRRLRAGASPQEARAGLERAWRLVDAGGGGFNGVHRLRAFLRNPPAELKMANAGHEAGDFNAIASAMTEDLHGIVRKSSHAPIADSLKAFNEAEKVFGYLADENALFEKLRDASNGSTITKVLNAAKEKGGDANLLRRLRATMPTDEFERISGTLLNEMGENKAHDFSFAQFRKSWEDLSQDARNLLFTPQHQKFIEDVVNLAEHVRSADKLRNHSNTSGALILFELAKSAIELGIAAGAGAVSGKQLAYVGGTVAGNVGLGWLLSSPARAAATSAWVRAYRGATLNQPTPARIAAFKIATRNLANTIHLPVERVMSVISNRIPAPAVAGVTPDREKLSNGQSPRPQGDQTSDKQNSQAGAQPSK